MAALLVVFAGSVLDLGNTAAASINDKLQHVIGFLTLGLLGNFALPRRDYLRFTLPLLLGYGLLIECAQWQLPWREFSLLDLAADLGGLCLAAVVEKKLLRRLLRPSP